MVRQGSLPGPDRKKFAPNGRVAPKVKAARTPCRARSHTAKTLSGRPSSSQNCATLEAWIDALTQPPAGNHGAAVQTASYLMRNFSIFAPS
jgi:hypothetical protein